MKMLQIPSNKKSSSKILAITFCLLIVLAVAVVSFGIDKKQESLVGADLSGSLDKIDLIKDSTFIDDLRKNDTFRDTSNESADLKSYDSSLRKVTIEDSSFSKILEIGLKSNYSVTGLIYSNDTKVAEINLYDFGSKIELLFDSINLYDIKNNYSLVNRTIRFKYANFSQECHGAGKAQECYDIKTWIPFSSLKELPSKNLTIGLFTETFSGEHIEWVPKVQGFEILEWGDWEVATAGYFSKSYQQSDGTPMEMYITTAGTSLYVVGTTADNVTEYTLSTAWDISTASATGDSFHFPYTSASAITFKPDGTKMYFIDGGGRDAYQYSLSPAWDLSSATYDAGKTFGIHAEELSPFSLFFKPDGLKLYIAGYGDDAVHMYTLSSAWDISSATHTEQGSIGTEISEGRTAFFKSDGTKMYATGRNTDIVQEYSLSTAWNVTTLSPTYSYDKSSQSTSTVGMFFKTDGSLMYLVDWNDYIYQYSLNGTLPECQQNSNCDANQYCDGGQTCQSDLADGATCDGETYVATNAEEDGACTNGYCDSDGVGVSDDGHCFTPYNTYFDGQENTYCEFSTDTGVSDTDEKTVGTDLNTCDDVGQLFYEDEVSSTCGYVDITTDFECTDSGCSCVQPLCDNGVTGTDVDVCTADETYFADECTSTAGGEDRNNICQNSSFDASCTGDDACGGIEAGTGDCTLACVLDVDRTLEITDPITGSPVSVSSGDNITLTFNFLESGSNITSSVTLESIFIGGSEATVLGGEGGTPETSQISYEDFEGHAELYEGDYDYWLQATFDTAGEAWGVYTGNGQSSNTGPTSNYDGYYAMVETSSGQCNDPDTAVMYNSPAIDFDSYDYVNISFAYNLYGNTMGDLHIKENTTGVWLSVWQDTDDSTTWHTHNHGFTDLTGTGNIAIWLDCGASYQSDGAVDSVNITGTTGGAGGSQFSYIAGVGWQVNVTVPDFEEGIKDLYINATYSGETVDDTETNAVSYGVSVYNLTIVDPTTAVPESVSTGDNITVKFNFLQEGSNITSGLTLGDIFIGGSTATILTQQTCTGTLDCSVYSNETACDVCGQCNWTSGGATDDTNITCSGVWGFDCTSVPDGGDNTFDACDSETGTYEAITGLKLNATTVGMGDTILVSCKKASPAYDADDQQIAYRNSTTGEWQQIQLWTTSWDAETWYTVAIPVDDVLGEHQVRCSVTDLEYSGTTGVCFGGQYMDNDDINFTVIETSSCTEIDGGACSSCAVGDCEADCSEAGCSLDLTDQFSFLDGYWNANVTVPVFGSGLKDLFVNATYSGTTANNTESEAINYGAVGDTTPPYFTSIPANATLYYWNESLGVEFDAEDETSFDDFSVNDSRFTINSTGWLSNNTVLGIGTYILNITIQDSSANENSTLYKVTINQNTLPCDVLFNESSPITYPSQFQVYSNCNSAFTLYRNGTVVSNNSVQDPGAGVWNYTVMRSDNINFTNYVDEEFFTVSKGVSVGSLTNSVSWSIVYGTEVTIGLSESQSGDGDVTYIVYRDGVSKGTGETWSPGTGTYDYVLNTTGGANWTSNASMEVQTLTVTDENYPIFSDYWDDNATIEGSGTAHFNVSIANTNGTVGLEIDGANHTGTIDTVYSLSYQEDANATACEDDWDGTYTCANTYDGDWDTWGQGGFSGTVFQNFTIPSNEVAGSFLRWKSGWASNSGNETLFRGCFDEGVLQIKGESFDLGEIATVFCWNYTASDWKIVGQDTSGGSEGKIYDVGIYWNVSESYYIANASLSGEGTYPYYWWAYGDGDTNLFNVSETRDYYVNATADLCGTQITSSTTLTEDLDCPNDGLILNADDIILDCAGFTINYSSSGTEGDRGLEGWGHHVNVTIKNCNVQMTNTTSAELYRQGITNYDSSNFQVINTSVDVWGNNPTIEAWGTSQSNMRYMNISGCTLVSHEYDGIGLGDYALDANVEYSNITSAQVPIYTWTGADNITIHNNIINSTDNIDGRGISLRGVMSGAQIYDNTIYAEYRGIYAETNTHNISNNIIEAGTGIYLSQSNNTLITDNTITTSDDYVSAFEGAGIYSDGEGVIIRDNIITTSGLTAVGIAFAGGSDSIIDNATITTTQNSSYGIYVSNGANGNIIENSTILTSGESLAVGLYIYGDNNNVTNVNSTTTGGDDSPGYGIGSASLLVRDSDNVYITDTILNAINSDDIQARGTLDYTATFINVTYSEIAFNVTDVGQYLDFYWYMDVHVNNSAGNLEDANVSIFDLDSNLLHTELTDAGGDISQQLLEAFIANGSIQTDYTPHTVNVTKAGYTTNSTSYNLTSLNNVIATIMMTEADSTPPYFTTIPADDSITYGENWTGVDFDADDAGSSIDSYWVNDSRFTINSTGFLDDLVILGAGSYYLNVSINDTEGNENSTLYTLTVNTASPSGSLAGTSPISYGTAGDVEGNESNTGDGDLTYKLYREGVEASNPDTAVLGAGVYSYVYNTTGGANYSANASMDTFSLTVNPVASQTSLIFDKASPQIFGTSINASCSAITGEGTPLLYRDGVDVTALENNKLILLSVDSYDYVCNMTATQNYTTSTNSSSFTISQAVPTGSLESSAGWTLTYPTETIISLSESNTGDGDLTYIIYRDGVSVGTGETETFGYGIYDYVLNTTGGANYTSNSSMDVETLTINKNAGSCDVLFNETTPQNYPKEFRVYSNCDSGFVLYRNETVITNNSVQSLSAGSWNFTVQRNDSVNYTNIYDEEIFVISKATTSISVNGTSPINYGVTGDVEGTGCPAGVTCNLFREGVEVSNPDAVILGAGVYNYVYNTTGNENYTSDSDTFELTINKGTGLVYTYLNNSRSNESIYEGESIWLNGTLETGSGIIKLYNNGTLINSGASPLSNLTAFSTEGTYNITTIYEATQNYTASFETWFVIVSVVPDITDPEITIITPPNNTNSTDYGLDVNFTVSDNIAVDSCWWSDDGGAFNVSNPSCENMTDIGGWVEGINTVWVWVNDTSGNEARDEVTFRIDTKAPIFTSIVDQTINETETLSYTPTASDAGVGFDSWDINATEMITINSGTGEITNISALIIGYYSYNVSINDTLGNTNSTIWNLNVTAVDQVNPSVSGLTENPVDGSEYSPGQSYEFNATVTDDNLDTVTIEFDGVNYSTSNLAGDVFNFTISDLAVGTYNYVWYANDSFGNENNSLSGSYEVIQNSSYVLAIDLSPSDSEVYGVETTATGSGCPSGVTCNLFINDSSASNPDVQTLGAGVWSYTFNTTGNVNYSSSSISDLLTISKTSSQTNLTFDKTSPQDYGTEIIPSCSIITGEGSAVLTLDGDIITSGVGVTLGVGIYSFNCSLTESTNYSYSENVSSFTISQISSEVYTYLNNSRSNTTIYSGQSIWLNGTLNTGEGSINLYNNGTLINSGASPLSNLTTFSDVGLHNITTTYEATQNYTSTSETWWVNVTTAPDTTKPYFTSIPANASISYGEDWDGVDFDAEDETLFDSFFIDDTTNFTINSTGFLDNNTFLFVGTYLINVSINDSSNNINFTIYEVVVGKATPTGTLNSNATWTIAPGDSVIINFTETNEGDSDVNYTVYRDGIYIGSGETWSPAPGTYTYILNTTGGENYSSTASIDTQVLTVTSAGIPLIEFTNGTEENNSFFQRDWIFANVSVTIVSEDTIIFNLYNSSHDIINSSSFTDSTRTINWTNLTDGQYYYNVTINNTGGGSNSTETRLITLDNDYGDLSIIIPIEGSAYGNVVTSVNVDVNYSVENETNLDSCWYRLRGVQTIPNTTTPCDEGYNNFTITISNFGYLTLDVFSNDSASNEETDLVNFYVNQYTGPQQGGGSNTNPNDNDYEDVTNQYNATVLCSEVKDFLSEHQNYSYEEKESFRNALAILFGFAIEDQLLSKYLNDYDSYCQDDEPFVPEEPKEEEKKPINYWVFAICILSILILILILMIAYHRERLVLMLNWLKREDEEEKPKQS